MAVATVAAAPIIALRENALRTEAANPMIVIPSYSQPLSTGGIPEFMSFIYTPLAPKSQENRPIISHNLEIIELFPESGATLSCVSSFITYNH